MMASSSSAAAAAAAAAAAPAVGGGGSGSAVASSSATGDGVGGGGGEPAASQTLYLNNMDTRVPKKQLRRALYALCSSYGVVVDVVAKRTVRMRGQAHVVFADLAAAARARRALQGFPLFGTPLRVQFARGKSDALARVAGRPGPSAATLRARAAEQSRLEAEAAARLAAGGRVGTGVPAKEARALAAAGGSAASTGDSTRKRKLDGNGGGGGGDGDKGGDNEGDATKDGATDAATKKARTGGAGGEPEAPPPRPQNNPPHNVLLVEHLPAGTGDAELAPFFAQRAGFVRTRAATVRGRALAFVDFDTPANAGAALAANQGAKLSAESAHGMVVSFAKAS